MSYTPTDRSRLRRIPERASYDRETVHSILDEAPICHVGFSIDGQTYVIPTIHARMDDRIILHGARASRLLKHAATGGRLCITATILDGLVLARSVFHHSMNYRSVVAFGQGRLLEDADEKMAALAAVSDHLLKGRWEDARQPNDKEMYATSVIEMRIEEATAKTRSGPPGDDEEDYALPVWAGVLPMNHGPGTPEADPGRHRDEPLPDYLRDLV